MTHLFPSKPTLVLGPGLRRPTNGTYDAAHAIIFMFAMALNSFG
jgi:hypothetical protein